MAPKLTDELLLSALNEAYLRTEVDKQLTLTGSKKKTTKINWYSFPVLFAQIKSAGVFMTEQGVRQRIYAINKAIRVEGQVYKAEKVKGAPRKKKDYSAFLK